MLFVRYPYRNRGLIFAAFGAGLILALCFPTKIMIFILAALLIVLGIFTVC